MSFADINLNILTRNKDRNSVESSVAVTIENSAYGINESGITDNEGALAVPITYTSVEPDNTRVRGYKLYQNYPNPFNPETVVNYSLGKSGDVSIIIYSILGQKIKKLVNEFQGYGEHSVKWDGRNENGQIVSDGVYIYRIISGDFVETKKMAHMKGISQVKYFFPVKTFLCPQATLED